MFCLKTKTFTLKLNDKGPAISQKCLHSGGCASPHQAKFTHTYTHTVFTSLKVTMSEERNYSCNHTWSWQIFLKIDAHYSSAHSYFHRIGICEAEGRLGFLCMFWIQALPVLWNYSAMVSISGTIKKRPSEHWRWELTSKTSLLFANK